MSENERAQLEEIFNYPLFQALMHRRSRRFRLGHEIGFGPLKYKSERQALPLNKLETALLCFAGAGSTGLALSEVAPGYGINTMMNWSSRAYPSPCNSQRTHLLFTNDDGVYLYKPRESQKAVAVETLEDLQKMVQTFDQDLIKLKDGRLDLAPKPPLTWSVNTGMVNRRGQTMFMPIIDPGFEFIDMALLTIQYDHYLFYDDLSGKPAGVDKWINKLNLNIRVPLSTLDWYAGIGCSLEAGFICQNILLMSQAMGIGAFPFSGFVSLMVMGGTPATRGLGFRFTTDKKGMPNPVGIDGVMEGYCPPYKTMDEAVDAVVAAKFGPGGIFTKEARTTPFLNQAAIADAMVPDRIPEDVIQCTKDLCNYIYKTYGRFPATADTMSLPLGITTHHIDTGFYQKYYKEGAVADNQVAHLAKWHLA